MSQDDKLKKLYSSIGKIMSSSMDYDQIVNGIMQEIESFFKPENWSLFRLDHSTNALFFVIAEGLDLNKMQNVRIKMGEGIVGTVAETGKSIFLPDATNDPRFSTKVDDISGFKTESIIAVPIVFRDTVYGVIELINCADHSHFSEDDHFILQTIADFSAIAMANAFLYAKTVNVAYTDALTGALNRIRMDGIVKDWQALDSSDSPEGVTIAMIDLNNFKNVNDNYGHREGDKILIITSKSIEGRLKSHDMFFRTGGDEFVVLSPLATMEMSNAVESRIHENMVSANNFLEELETGFDFPVLFSYGIVSGPVKEFNEVMNKADAAMFENKKEFKAKYGSFVR